MGGGNGQKSATARARKQAEKDAEKAKHSSFGRKGSSTLGGLTGVCRADIDSLTEDRKK